MGIILAVTLLIYVRGVAHLWLRFGSGHLVAYWQAAAFFGGIVALMAALVSPLDTLSEVLFSAHMGQHLLLIVMAAPLIAYSRPLVPFLWGLPLRWRRSLRGWQRITALRTWQRLLTDLLFTWILYTVVLWFWHLPGPYQAALHNWFIHALEHIAFLGTALLYCWTLSNLRDPCVQGRGILSLFTMGLQSGLLGALLTFSSLHWYPDYAATAPVWGLTPLEDQQLAGLIMWIPMGTVYMLAALTLLRTWLQGIEQRTRFREGEQS
jgi:putative membrane protein